MTFSLSPRGAELDVIIAIVAVVGIAILAPILKVVMDATGNKISESNITSDEVNQILPTKTSGFFNIMDSIPVFLFIGVIAVAAYLAYLSPSNPMMLIFVFFLLVFLILVAVIFSNMHETFSQSTQNITDAVGSMPKTNRVMENLPIFAVVGFFIVAGVLYSRFT